jgi:hypothetical protein
LANPTLIAGWKKADEYRRTEAEHDDDDGVDREGVERGSSTDSFEGIMGE